jgi:peptidoglycan/xylan/chitin deacetylase (PgdA/CDA1 family)
VAVVLCYHAVSADWDHPIAVRPETLSRQLRALTRWGWRPAGVSDVIGRRSRALHVTFDDAYRSIVTALPVLEQFGLRPTVFACTDYAANGGRLELPPLNRLPAARRDELATLSWDGLRGLADRGAEIGSHTRTHPDLRFLPDSELRDEITASRDEIESELGRRCRYFAYPYGQFDRRVRRAVERAGYEGAFGLLGVGPLGGRLGIARLEPARSDGDLAMPLKGSPVWRTLARPTRRLRGARRLIA